MTTKRTLTELRNTLQGKIYIYFDNEEICCKFLQDAEDEGYRFGSMYPTQSSRSNIIALENDKKLSHVGYVGHVAFQCPSGVVGGLHRVDYEKYVKGDEDFFYKNRKEK